MSFRKFRQSPQWTEVTALFGGRFDPPHLGHREAVKGLFKEPKVKQVWVIPSAAPPHKPTHVSAKHRAEMARLNFSSTLANPFPHEVRVDLCELERSVAQPHRPSYTFDTLQQLRSSVSELAFVIGADQLAQLPSWHRFPELLSLSHWIVLERGASGRDTAQQVLTQWEASGLVRATQSKTWQIQGGLTSLVLVPTDAPDVSSTQIREAISRTGEPPADALLPEVLGYLKINGLYGMQRLL